MTQEEKKPVLSRVMEFLGAALGGKQGNETNIPENRSKDQAQDTKVPDWTIYCP